MCKKIVSKRERNRTRVWKRSPRSYYTSLFLEGIELVVLGRVRLIQPMH